MIVIPEDVSSQIITHEIAYDAVRQAFLDTMNPACATFPVVIAHGVHPENIFSIKSAAAVDLAGLKIGSFWPTNAEKGLPRHSTTILLVDQEDGTIKAAVSASAVNAYRTAAADAVAADLLARQDAERLTVFGTGHQALYECLALMRIRPLKEIRVVGRRPEAAQNFARTLEHYGLTTLCVDPRDGCENADIIVTATTAKAPLFDQDWVRAGTHVASMGSDSRGKQELPPLLLCSASLFCDLTSQSRTIGEFQHAPLERSITPIGAVLSGQSAGRVNESEITVFDSSGLSLQDLHVAAKILDIHQARQTAGLAQ